MTLSAADAAIVNAAEPELAVQCLAGLDEAGLGPILGPLVVAGVAMTGPRGKDPWQLLRPIVCRQKSVRGKLRVADSKVVNQGPKGLEHLEYTVLAFWSAWRGSLPRTLEELLVGLDVALGPLRACPWYEDLALPLPLMADPQTLELRAYRLTRALGRAGVKLEQIAVRPVDAEEFNGLLASTANKSSAHFAAYASVLSRRLARVPAGAHVVADRCGGIMHYVPSLERCCPGLAVRIVREEAAASVYDVGAARGEVRVTFAVEGEERAFPTALASCFAKYLREAMLRLLNRWFQERVPDLRPTAGYFADGRRFLKDVRAVVEAGTFPRARLVRAR